MNKLMFAACVMVGCNAAQSATSTPLGSPAPRVVAPSAPSSVEKPLAVPPAPAAPAPAAPATRAETARAPLPPPLPTTIPLATTGDAPLDKLLDEGDKAFEAGDWARAADRYAAASKSAPKRVEPRVGLLRVRVAATGSALDYGAAEGHPEIGKAARELAKLLLEAPDLGALHAELGAARLMLADATGSLASLRRAVELLPRVAETHSMLGVALFATGDRTAAATELRKAAELDPGRAERHGNLGAVVLSQGRVQDALAEFELQVAAAPSDARARSDLGTALLAANDLPRATRELEEAKRIDPRRASYRVNLGYALQRAGRVSEGIAEYREAIRLDPRLSSAWINLATALARDPATRKEAREALEKARAIDPSDPSVKANLDELDALERGHSTP